MLADTKEGLSNLKVISATKDLSFAGKELSICFCSSYSTSFFAPVLLLFLTCSLGKNELYVQEGESTVIFLGRETITSPNLRQRTRWRDRPHRASAERTT